MIITEEQAAIRDMARDFAQNELLPNAAAWDRESRFPREAITAMGALGMMGMLVPEEWSGAGVDHVAYALAVEEVAAGDGAVSTIMSVHNSVACMPVLKYGTERQKTDFLVPLATGKFLGGFALTEPQAGSDASNLRTRARRTNDGYVLDGAKQFITSGKNGDMIIVFAVTDPAAGKKGITAFLVPTTTPGYEVARVEAKLGLKSSDTAHLVFTDMAIPETLRLGAEGEGYRIALSNLEGGRIGIAAQAVGMARAALDHAMTYAKDRKAFGGPLTDLQAISFRLADMATEIECARHMVLHAAALRDAGLPCLKEACMAKLYASEMAERVCSAAIQVHGGYGYLADFPVERIFRDVRICQIYEGTSDIQRLVIARQLLAA